MAFKDDASPSANAWSMSVTPMIRMPSTFKKAVAAKEAKPPAPTIPIVSWLSAGILYLRIVKTKATPFRGLTLRAIHRLLM